MLIVHHLGLSQSERVVWLCEELGLDYQLKRYDRRSDNRLAPDAYKALHPMGIAPVIYDDNLVVAESGAICEYLNVKYGGGKLAPDPSAFDYAEYLFWFHWSNATYMATKMIGMALTMAGQGPEAVPFVQERLGRNRDLLEGRLAISPYLGGRELTLADIMIVYSLTTSRTFSAAPLDDMPNTRAYLHRISKRPAYLRAMAKAEPGMVPILD